MVLQLFPQLLIVMRVRYEYFDSRERQRVF